MSKLPHKAKNNETQLHPHKHTPQYLTCSGQKPRTWRHIKVESMRRDVSSRRFSSPFTQEHSRDPEWSPACVPILWHRLPRADLTFTFVHNLSGSVLPSYKWRFSDVDARSKFPLAQRQINPHVSQYSLHFSVEARARRTKFFWINQLTFQSLVHHSNRNNRSQWRSVCLCFSWEFSYMRRRQVSSDFYFQVSCKRKKLRVFIVNMILNFDIVCCLVLGLHCRWKKIYIFFTPHLKDHVSFLNSVCLSLWSIAEFFGNLLWNFWTEGEPVV